MAFDSGIKPMTRLNRLSQLMISSWVVIISLLQHQVIASIGNNSFSPLTTKSHRTHFHDDGKGTINDHIRDILNERLDKVLTGKRKSLFNKKYKRGLDAIDGEFTTIISAHGREVEHRKDQENVGPRILNETNVGHSDTNHIFPEDISSLELVLTPAMKQIAQREIKIRNKMERLQDQSVIASELFYVPKLVFRAIRLGFHFTPVFTTAGLAAISSGFRKKYWYGLVAHCLSSCGPAFIKWGELCRHRASTF